MTEAKLFSPIRAGALDLFNRIAMAPLTRNRARPLDDTPHALNAEYYAQRASVGLLITEASQISPEGKGYAWTPGIYSPEQVEGWKAVTEAVHARGGKIVIQLWHVGRISHTSLQPNGQPPVAPSAIGAGAKTFDGKNFVETSIPRALGIEEIPRILADYVLATRNARAAGFDGVEIHAANGYLINQFLEDGSNRRTDAYGGSIENRTRFLREVIESVTNAWDKDHVGIRLSPFASAQGVSDSDPVPLFNRAVDIVNEAGLAYLHMIEGKTGGSRELAPGQSIQALRKRFKGVYIANNGYDRDMAIKAVESGHADVVAFGRLLISNPDLVERLRRNAPLNEPDPATFYGGGAEGYTDYPFLADVSA
ncbi:MAG: alkene reductase [Cereibacter sphaeroides]|uniref:Alkene reductase n=1 Tax=Cereibacter sphaeroides TaxID=1063 RepID=A0A2W5SC47_CERSP|nr:MAG: alkene reductase [Cereibacter sphaeroides]